MEKLIENGIECYCYGNVGKEDPVTDEIRRDATRYRSIWGVADDAAARQIIEDEIDVLVDLAGHTAENRLQLFSMRPAPLQVAYLGYPNTSGLDAMDGRIVDRTTDPEDQPWFGTEKLARLDRCFLSYRPVGYPAIVEPPSSRGAPVTFGSFNNLGKLNEEVIAVWSAILTGSPGSRLLIKHNVSGDPLVQGWIVRQFEDNGIGADRLVFRDRAPSLESHLSMYGEVDVALDPFPYNGTTTTCEALWMGVPVVALLGDHHASRVSASVLQSIGFEAGIATSIDDYVNTALQLSSSAALLGSMRQMLRQSMVDSPLGDPQSLAVALIDAVGGLWDQRSIQHDIATEKSGGAAAFPFDLDLPATGTFSSKSFSNHATASTPEEMGRGDD